MSSRLRLILILLLLLLAVVALLLFGRCRPERKAAPVGAARIESPSRPVVGPAAPVAPAVLPPEVEERLTAATLVVPGEIDAGAPLAVTWSGPDNAGDYVTVVRPAAGPTEYGSYRETRAGPTLELTAPGTAGAWEVRYVTGRSRTVLARAALEVKAVGARLTAPADVVAGARFEVEWNGPGHAGDYVTIVPRGTPDGQYRNYTDTARGSPLPLTAPIEPGDAEVRYMTGSPARVLARRGLRVVAAQVTLAAPAEVIAGSPVAVTWEGPGNAGDYLTIVPRTMRDGQYGNYTDVAKGSPLRVTAPIEPGPAEVRYMSGQGARVLSRRELVVVPARISLQPPARAGAGTSVSLPWTGPGHAGDYLTVVPRVAKDGAMYRMTSTAGGSPARVDLPPERGPAEVRYMSGQGNRVLARAPIDLD